MACIQVALTIRNILSGQEHLGDNYPMGSKKCFIVLHEDSLTHSSCCLLFRNRPGLARKPQSSHPGTDRPRADKYDIPALFPEGCQILHQTFYAPQVELTPAPADNLRPNLHNNPACLFHFCSFTTAHQQFSILPQDVRRGDGSRVPRWIKGMVLLIHFPGVTKTKHYITLPRLPILFPTTNGYPDNRSRKPNIGGRMCSGVASNQ